MAKVSEGRRRDKKYNSEAGKGFYSSVRRDVKVSTNRNKTGPWHQAEEVKIELKTFRQVFVDTRPV